MEQNIIDRLEAIERILGRCEECGEFKAEQISCEGCSSKICKCNRFYESGDIFKFCSRSCLNKHFDDVYESRSGYPPSEDFRERIREIYEDR